MIFGGKTHFSIGQSIVKPEQLVNDAATIGHSFLAVADTGSINALPIIFNEAKKNPSIDVNVGVALRVVDDPSYKRPTKKDGGKPHMNGLAILKFYPQNEAGLKTIFRMLTLANRKDHVASEFKAEHSGPQISWEEAYEFLKEGNLIVTTGDLFGLFSSKNWKTKAASLFDACNSMNAGATGKRSAMFVELVPVETAYHDSANVKGCEFALSCDLPILMSIPTLYVRGNADIRDVMNDIVDKGKVTSRFRNIPQSRIMTILDPEEIEVQVDSMFKRLNIPRFIWLGGGKEFAKLSEYRYENMPVSLPDMAADPFRKLAELSMRGWKERIEKPVMGYKPDASLLPKYRDRLKYELGVLNKMGFENYFLVVEELVNWSKSNGIRVGPGRGSVGGSLVAFLIGITDVDPIRFGLLFERFINPDRLDLPDADLDFMSSRREEVINHLIDKYGQSHVACISNYNMLASASALRAAGKAFGLEEWEMDCSKLVPKEHGQPKSLEEAVKEVAEIEKFAIQHPKIFETACKLQDTYRAAAQHAAGVIVAGCPIIERAAIEERETGLVVNWDKQVVENFGLVKLDVLGLSTLDVIDKAIQYISEAGPKLSKRVDMMNIRLDDKKVLEAFGKGKTVGVFQFESGGMRELLKNMAASGILTFDDLAAATALYRPGPLDAGLLDKYVAIKQGSQREDYPHPNAEEALRETYSVIVYQEQVMKLAQDLAGFSMVEADHLRKAMGKKDKDKMAKMRDKWVDGCVNNSGMTKEYSAELFDQIEKFAGYGFNKSHAVEYSIISFWTMWLKTYHPTSFFAACLTVLGEDKWAGLIKDAAAHDILVLPPDLNISTTRYEVAFDAARGKEVLYMPFQAIKGVSEKGSNAIVKARDGKPFTSVNDFINRVEKRVVNIRVREALAKVGATASLDPAEKPMLHPERLKDQKVLLGDLMRADVKADRTIDVDAVKPDLVDLYKDVQSCSACSLGGQCHPMPKFGKKPKFMMVFDSPNYSEDSKGEMLAGDASKYIRDAIKDAGLQLGDGYYTALVKSKKPSKGKLENDMINGCSPYLSKEVALLKPPIIVCMGSASIRHFAPEVKGGWAELLGQSYYDPKLDATIVFGMNPAMVYMDPSKQKLLNQVTKQVFDLVT